MLPKAQKKKILRWPTLRLSKRKAKAIPTSRAREWESLPYFSYDDTTKRFSHSVEKLRALTSSTGRLLCDMKLQEEWRNFKQVVDFHDRSTFSTLRRPLPSRISEPHAVGPIEYLDAPNRNHSTTRGLLLSFLHSQNEVHCQLTHTTVKSVLQFAHLIEKRYSDADLYRVYYGLGGFVWIHSRINYLILDVALHTRFNKLELAILVDDLKVVQDVSEYLTWLDQIGKQQRGDFDILSFVRTCHPRLHDGRKTSILCIEPASSAHGSDDRNYFGGSPAVFDRRAIEEWVFPDNKEEIVKANLNVAITMTTKFGFIPLSASVDDDFLPKDFLPGDELLDKRNIAGEGGGGADKGGEGGGSSDKGGADGGGEGSGGSDKGREGSGSSDKGSADGGGEGSGGSDKGGADGGGEGSGGSDKGREGSGSSDKGSADRGGEGSGGSDKGGEGSGSSDKGGADGGGAGDSEPHASNAGDASDEAGYANVSSGGYKDEGGASDAPEFASADSSSISDFHSLPHSHDTSARSGESTKASRIRDRFYQKQKGERRSIKARYYAFRDLIEDRFSKPDIKSLRFLPLNISNPSTSILIRPFIVPPPSVC
ncbi:hypothetical protein D9757_010756 [Collybiopsis confluens]|uniref:Uncharacterized protein n=1 Tax=Collybiopsis confluens TaxID=2823264 RepID=A0A8H5H8R3_9AGAR|nr:hypothetical protein D9757_010756 [Collybiopsis confluens]